MPRHPIASGEGKKIHSMTSSLPPCGGGLGRGETCQLTDDQGNPLHLKQPAQRIISLAPDITENLFAIGAGQQIIGVIQGSDYPTEAKKIPIVGSYTGLDLEAILALKPDLIVTWSTMFARQLQALTAFNIPIYVTQPKQLEDIPRTLRNLGCLTGQQQKANQAATDFLQTVTQIEHHYNNKTNNKPRVFYQIGAYTFMTVNKESWIQQVVAACGGQPLFTDTVTIAPTISLEAILTANPQIIISSASNDQWQTRWQRWPSIAAVKNGLLFTIPSDWLERASPRLLLGMRQVCTHIHFANDSR
ncbi:MAG TPA: cobalamin-binding protein [Gammaproteobacteria bacterium]|nr:cobalamin-binding protein [Gammaproteobacteria bacterium]